MNLIDRIEIEGFWGKRSIEVQLNSDVNFLIGKNGAGKTTFVNLIAAVLEADWLTLERIDFQHVRVILKTRKSFAKPSITVEKKKHKDLPFPEIQYKIKRKISEKKSQTYSLSDYMERRLIRGRRYQRELRSRRVALDTNELTQQLEKLVRMSWLSIHRSETASFDEREDNYESTVDRKLHELNNNFIRYFSELSRERD
ncbi:MAG: AAA family ATPase [Rhodospirillales bacterium]|nr:AAA family ATPase [Rhodospirillales bacterium]